MHIFNPAMLSSVLRNMRTHCIWCHWHWASSIYFMISHFVFPRKNKVTWAWKDIMRVSKRWQNFHFEWTISSHIRLHLLQFCCTRSTALIVCLCVLINVHGVWVSAWRGSHGLQRNMSAGECYFPFVSAFDYTYIWTGFIWSLEKIKLICPKLDFFFFMCLALALSFTPPTHLHLHPRAHTHTSTQTVIDSKTRRRWRGLRLCADVSGSI